MEEKDREVVVLDEGLDIEDQATPMSCCWGSLSPYRT